MAQMPDIKPEINREPEKEKKGKGGLFGRLFGGGATGGGAGVGAGGFGGAGGMGGLLATKTGILALVLAGTTVAGGIGMVGYRLFGPGADESNSDNLKLFAARPKDGGEAGVVGEKKDAAPADGHSDSLSMAAQANAPKEAETKPAEAPKDETAAGAASAAAGAAGGANGPINSSASSGSELKKNLLNTGKKFGALSGPGSVSSGGGNYSANGGGASRAATTNAAADAAASKNNQLSAMHKGTGLNSSNARAVARRAGSSNAVRQAFGALGDNRGAQSSYAGGRTYDGASAASAGNNIGATGSDIGLGGVGDGTSAQPKSNPNTALQKNEFTPPPTPDPKSEAPWQNAINTAQMMLAAGGLLLYLIGQIKIPWIRYALAAVVAAMGAAIIKLGSDIASGPYGQTLQGHVLGAAGAGLMIAAVLAAMSTSDNTKATNKDGSFTADGNPVDGGGEAVDISDKTGEAKNNILGMNPYVLLGGGSALIGIATVQMKPPTKYPSTNFNQNNPMPDDHWFGYQEYPSETALKKMVA